MPPDARALIEEGVVLPPIHALRGGRPRWSAIRARLTAPPFPTRNVEDNLADLRAAAAANHAGAALLQALAADLGAGPMAALMRDLQRVATRRVREALRALPAGDHEAAESLDDGSILRVRVALSAGRARVDFAGTAGVHPGNLNATPAIVRSVVMYVLRLLIRDPLPLNEGLLRAVTLKIPRGLLNPDFPDDAARAPAIVGGNVETSQRLVDTILKALRLAACSQGTMNNVLFGDPRFGYYETIGGGAGAGPGFHGAGGVHCHMTNTRITDVEVLEQRHGVRVERFALRRGSGGEGRYRGGDGIVRALRFLAPVSVSVLGQHRIVPPYGLEGGGPGRRGAQRIERAGGEIVTLPGAATCEASAGDLLVIETPGGGGYGPAASG
jgi:5-oxoprolinase (ATP-hydrolysing)